MTDTDTTAASQDLTALKLPELRRIAAERGLKSVSALRKGALIEAIRTGVVPKGAVGRGGETESAGGHVSGGRDDRQDAEHGAKNAAPDERTGASEDTHESEGSRAESEQQREPRNDSGENTEQRYESRSAARRARRNRARQSPDDHENTSDNGREQHDNRDHRDNRNNPDRGSETREDDTRGENRPRRDNNQDNNRDSNRDNNRDADDNDGTNRRGRRNRRNRNRGRENGENQNNHQSGQNSQNPQDEPEELLDVAGIVDVVDNNSAFLRTTGYRQSPADVFIHSKLVRQNGLRSGDAVVGQVRSNGQGHTHGNGRNRQRFNQLVRVDSVNGVSPEEARQRKEFHKLTPLYPNKRLRLETEPNILTTRVIDLVMPIGKGQRALIVSPPKAGKTTILQNIANAIATNNPECYLMVVLVDERPEEVTDMQRGVKGEVIASTFDRPPSEHTAVAELAIERAKRLVEMGQDVVVLLDSITRLGRAYNNSSPASGRILSGGVDSNALYPPKRFLGAARNIEEGGSLTIIATAMVETGSAGDTVIFEEFKGTGNAELKLDRKIAERRVFPAVDVNPSGTRKDELLMSPEEARIMHKLRRILSALDPHQSIDMLIKQLKKTKTNGEFLMGVAQSAPMAADQDEEEYS
ncbi:hypothetical protein CAPI_06525 [Corynebacterium capitovis DSM 44611]|uniref:transcription termination factor Rho n=1 Tax=Corynebacterium capitovis TaxID=131081 RepID=UPI0003604E2B|nr:transcription termination factor Rho [Corynebacterium capitovis]WKD57846.1 hypothetical protein CAPI_06525 [Corynebacterium capitovis DSM 44611]